jgi:hypothetical protein
MASTFNSASALLNGSTCAPEGTHLTGGWELKLKLSHLTGGWEVALPHGWGGYHVIGDETGIMCQDICSCMHRKPPEFSVSQMWGNVKPPGCDRAEYAHKAHVIANVRDLVSYSSDMKSALLWLAGHDRNRPTTSKQSNFSMQQSFRQLLTAHERANEQGMQLQHAAEVEAKVDNLADAIVLIDIPDGKVYAVHCFVVSLVGKPGWLVDMRFEFVLLLSSTTASQQFRSPTPNPILQTQLLVSSRRSDTQNVLVGFW